YTFESTASSNYLAAEDMVAGPAGTYGASWTTDPAANWQNVLAGIVSANASVSASASQITMLWRPSTDDTGVTAYLIERCEGAGCSSFVQTGTSPTTSYTDTGLTSNTTYSYRVRATDAAENVSGYSNTATITT